MSTRHRHASLAGQRASDRIRRHRARTLQEGGVTRISCRQRAPMQRLRKVTLDVRTESVAVFDDFTTLTAGLPDLNPRRVKSALYFTINARDNYV